jgi:hypothetical protein
MESNDQMRSLGLAVAILLAVWGITLTRRPGDAVWVHPSTGTGPARILRFYASTGAASPGQAVQVCYAVENARSVKISPLIAGTYPARNYCLELTPEHTMHLTLMAEGFDGSIAAKSFTLPVQRVQPVARPRPLNVAEF